MCGHDDCEFFCYGVCLFYILNLNFNEIPPCEKE